MMEPLTGIEPVTPSLPWTCSTTELQRLDLTSDVNSDRQSSACVCITPRCAWLGTELQRLENRSVKTPLV